MASKPPTQTTPAREPLAPSAQAIAAAFPTPIPPANPTLPGGGFVVALVWVPGLQVPAGLVAVPSSSSPGRLWLASGSSCSCPAGALAKPCWHRRAAAAFALARPFLPAEFTEDTSSIVRVPAATGADCSSVVAPPAPAPAAALRPEEVASAGPWPSSLVARHKARSFPLAGCKCPACRWWEGELGLGPISREPITRAEDLFR